MCPKNETAAWSQWSEWECSPNCTDTRMIRERHCEFNNSKDEIIVCDGPSNEHKDGNCTSNCPEEKVSDCPLGKWGKNCSQLCQFCDQGCNRINGTCQSCLPGYRYPHLGCNEACGKFTYGQFCEEDCLTKCDGQDCLDRNEGACPDVPYGLPSRFWLLLLLIPVTLLIYLRLCHRGSDTFEASLTSGSVQNLDKADSKSSIMSRISEWSKTLFRDKSTAPEDNLFKYDEKYGTYV
uniref:EGF-like domain-containing protein n=1 Tax=Biomphalaria glabrata TaxID=6526 RepID=A0A2C9LXR6_BIOGL